MARSPKAIRNTPRSGKAGPKKPLTPKRIAITAVGLIALLIAARLGLLPSNTGGGSGGGGGGGGSPDRVAQQTSRDIGGSHDLAANESTDPLRAAITQGLEDVWLTTTARVSKVLPDDNDGSRHQRFIIAIEPEARSPHGMQDTVLIAHNIDLAPRAPLEVGDTVTIRGEYIYKDNGGVIHWTHHDPRGRKQGGWIEVNGQRYE